MLYYCAACDNHIPTYTGGGGGVLEELCPRRGNKGCRDNGGRRLCAVVVRKKRCWPTTDGIIFITIIIITGTIDTRGMRGVPPTPQVQHVPFTRSTMDGCVRCNADRQKNQKKIRESERERVKEIVLQRVIRWKTESPAEKTM